MAFYRIRSVFLEWVDGKQWLTDVSLGIGRLHQAGTACQRSVCAVVERDERCSLIWRWKVPTAHKTVKVMNTICYLASNPGGLAKDATTQVELLSSQCRGGQRCLCGPGRPKLASHLWYFIGRCWRNMTDPSVWTFWLPLLWQLGSQLRPWRVWVGFHQGCLLSSSLFQVCVFIKLEFFSGVRKAPSF